MSFRVAALAFVLTALALAGCDTVTDPGGDTIKRNPSINDLRFQIDGASLDDDGSGADEADQEIDLGPYLQDPQEGGGFSKGEVETAEVTSVELELTSPASGTLSALESATLAFESDELGRQVVAEKTFKAGFGGRRVMLSARDVNVTAYVKQSSFEATLTIDARDPQPVAYSFYADVEMELDVAG